jgi:hypothetical protein
VPEGIESCAIVIEQAGSPYEIRALLPGSARDFTIPAGFLRAGQSYTFAIGTVAKDGNRSFIEARFATPARSNVRSARGEAAMSCRLFENGDAPALPLVRQPNCG